MNAEIDHETFKSIREVVNQNICYESEDFIENIGEYHFVHESEDDIENAIGEIVSAINGNSSADEILELVERHMGGCSHIYIHLLRTLSWTDKLIA